MVGLILMTTLLGALMLSPAGAWQRPQAGYGPTVGAYLANLDQELNELEYEWRRREISRHAYELARQRILILKRYVERHAALEHEDLIPELQVLTADEFPNLALSTEPDPTQLRPGMVLEGRWKLIGIEQQRFFVFMQAADRAEGDHRSEMVNYKSRASPPLQEVIETVVVREQLPFETARQTERREETTAPQPVSPAEALEPELTPPRVLRLHVPAYTPSARSHRVEGALILSALFQKDGNISQITVEQGLGYGLDERAIAAVQRIVFEPARLAGRPIDVRAQVVFTFGLDGVSAQLRASRLRAVSKKDQP
jgi:TonB family protein